MPQSLYRILWSVSVSNAVLWPSLRSDMAYRATVRYPFQFLVPATSCKRPANLLLLPVIAQSNYPEKINVSPIRRQSTLPHKISEMTIREQNPSVEINRGSDMISVFFHTHAIRPCRQSNLANNSTQRRFYSSISI